MATNTRTDSKTAKGAKPAAGGAKGAASPADARNGGGALGAQDVVAIDALDQATGESSTTRLDLADLLTHPSTSGALAVYRAFFEAGDVEVSAAIEALPRAIELAELERKLDVARAKVRRNRLKQAEPIAAVVFGVHRLVAATPKGSKMREAFDAFLTTWGETYTGNGGVGGGDEPPAPPAPTK